MKMAVDAVEAAVDCRTYFCFDYKQQTQHQLVVRYNSSFHQISPETKCLCQPPSGRYQGKKGRKEKERERKFNSIDEIGWFKLQEAKRGVGKAK